MTNYSGQFSMDGGPTFNYISVGKTVTVSVFAHGSLQGSATLDSTNTSATLYSASNVGDFTAVATLDIDSTTNIITLKYQVAYSAQGPGGTSFSGIIGSWGDS